MKTLNKKTLFWDAENLDPQINQKFIIERILDIGDLDDFKWAVGYYGLETVKKWVLESRKLNRKSLSFWCQFFNLDKSRCVKLSLRKPNAFWNRLPKVS